MYRQLSCGSASVLCTERGRDKVSLLFSASSLPGCGETLPDPYFDPYFENLLRKES